MTQQDWQATLVELPPAGFCPLPTPLDREIILSAIPWHIEKCIAFDVCLMDTTRGNISVRILIVDDHPLYLDAARQQVARIFRKADTATATSLAGALDILGQGPVDLVMLDFSMPGTDGLSAVKQVVGLAGAAPVVVMSGVALEKDVFACIQAGAKGFLPKTLDGPVFAAAVSLVASGGTYVPTEFMVTTPPPAPAVETGSTLDPNDFSERELALLRMVVAAASNKEIARAFDLQEVTIKFYLTRIFRKMGVKNRSHAAVIAVRSGLIRE